jgi:hypothetical protein
VKRFDLAAHPYDVNVRATWGRVSSSVYPTDDARILSPSAVPGAVPPWTLFEFFSDVRRAPPRVLARRVPVGLDRAIQK